MKIAKLVETIRDTDPEVLEGIPDKRANALIEAAFRHVNRSLMDKEKGLLAYEGLGGFVVRQVKKEIDGKAVTRTQIRFRRHRAGAARERAGKRKERGGSPG